MVRTYFSVTRIFVNGSCSAFVRYWRATDFISSATMVCGGTQPRAGDTASEFNPGRCPSTALTVNYESEP